ncbi:Predicted oxidoreductase [Amycolatopsis xylanica]|uniref:Predicted oxidoreductase n=1 Tax=Amycolatopsis xylanica TaxID=589385 RepID=A0A1H3EWC3_9PSEU|nr:aldo/keto reductase [Amycolatopsis xylanica]SDX82857.1 Predicted oxidoreductase [Amycolatopsis xylanica]
MTDSVETFALGGDLPVRRIGFGNRWLAGPNSWGPPEDPAGAAAVVHRAVELGVNFFDTADCYGPAVAEGVLADALHPYPEGLVVATKVGMTHPSPTEWIPLGRPEYLRQQVELSLRRLRLETVDLLYLHRIDPAVPLADQLGALAELREAGKIRHIGLSEVTVEQIKESRDITPIASVQNRYHLTDRKSEAVLDFCEQEGIAFVPFLPIGKGAHTAGDGVLATIAGELGATQAQVALAWLLLRSPVMLPIPGTKSLAHLAENVAAQAIDLTDDHLRLLGALSQ